MFPISECSGSIGEKSPLQPFLSKGLNRLWDRLAKKIAAADQAGEIVNKNSLLPADGDLFSAAVDGRWQEAAKFFLSTLSHYLNCYSSNEIFFKKLYIIVLNKRGGKNEG
ncbi:MAG: hypothetical protein ABII93_07670 [Chrysiogenia bacterium]